MQEDIAKLHEAANKGRVQVALAGTVSLCRPSPASLAISSNTRDSRSKCRASSSTKPGPFRVTKRLVSALLLPSFSLQVAALEDGRQRSASLLPQDSVHHLLQTTWGSDPPLLVSTGRRLRRQCQCFSNMSCRHLGFLPTVVHPFNGRSRPWHSRAQVHWIIMNDTCKNARGLG